MNIIQIFVLLIALPLMMTGCSEQNKNDSYTSNTPNQQVVTAPTDQWLGTWFGPEGTFLKITGGEGNYDLTIETLDGPRQFKGTAAGNQIHFQRDGVKESIRATDGETTGMKWLSEKTDCLTIVIGEGYCRD